MAGVWVAGWGVGGHMKAWCLLLSVYWKLPLVWVELRGETLGLFVFES